MNRFFMDRDGAPTFKAPDRVYARLIGGEDSNFVLFDAVDAGFFDRTSTRPDFGGKPGIWRDHVDQAPIYAIEVNASDSVPAAADWLNSNPHDTLPEWSEIKLDPNASGAALVYDNIAGPPIRANIIVRPLSTALQRALRRATDLTPEVKPQAQITRALPKLPIKEIFVLDVGQGSANALVTAAGGIIGYVDLGAGVLADAGTWPVAMGGICILRTPKVILTHWHYDHFHAANKYPTAQKLTWIAPLQPLGPGPQSAMASAIAATGTLMVWSGTGVLRSGRIEIERCMGPASNLNRTGIAVWILGSPGKDPILLPGDAGHSDIPSLTRGKAIAGFVAAHHGGRSVGSPPPRPTGSPRLAFSYGYANSYKHPLPNSKHALALAHWKIGHPAAGIDERRTEDRPGGSGGSGLGHIRMNWSGNIGRHRTCACGCTLDPTQ